MQVKCHLRQLQVCKGLTHSPADTNNAFFPVTKGERPPIFREQRMGSASELPIVSLYPYINVAHVQGRHGASPRLTCHAPITTTSTKRPHNKTRQQYTDNVQRNDSHAIPEALDAPQRAFVFGVMSCKFLQDSEGSHILRSYEAVLCDPHCL